ncbi:MAG: type II toxin-antitoxin system HipA family toxin YjjJ [Burkholderiales bacterium]|nr:type II toxin-antitoxin system HipA family toxin YjjJ [Burkholderiales bacterium]
MITPRLTPQVLQALRQHGGVASAAELQAALGVSQPTVSRALAPLVQSGQVHKVGAARSQRYVLPRAVAGVGATVPVMRVDAQGRPTPFGRLTPLAGGAVWVDEADGLSQRHDGLPWFLDDMRPQGFMGRTFAQAHPALQLGTHPRDWSADDVLRALALFGDDLPGNLVVGEAAFQRFHTLPERASQVDSADDYPRLADLAMQGTQGGSSAGGEQPKFCTLRAGRHVLVKFSPAGTAPTDQRTRDLLVCEHLALQTLAQAGVPAARTRLYTGAGRVFLESERFDRPPIGPDNPRGLGRVGMVSLQVYDAEYVGQMDNWAATAERMQARGLLTPEDARHLRLLEAFGALIANTDRHYGNISLLLDDDDWRLSPTYDMLPMLYAPVGGELVARDFAALPRQPTAATLPEWAHAQALAQTFWQTAAADERISPGFRTLAAENINKIRT